MVELIKEDQYENNSTEVQENEFSFLLFLILILLIMGNKNTFNAYFEVFDEEVAKANKIFKAFSVTADSLKVTFESPQKIMKELNLS